MACDPAFSSADRPLGVISSLQKEPQQDEQEEGNREYVGENRPRGCARRNLVHAAVPLVEHREEHVQTSAHEGDKHHEQPGTDSRAGERHGFVGFPIGALGR
jgi:hypothetical protein